jgi:hypothetical protein
MAVPVTAPRCARRLAALPAPQMRRAALREVLSSLTPADAARLCGELVRRGRDGAPYDVALLALNAVLDGGDLGYEQHAQLYDQARHLGDDALARLLLSAAPPPPGTPPPAVAIPGFRELTLGQKKSLARGRRREVLERLLRDPDVSVLRILLSNPRLTESDVVRVAARRPTTAAAQRAVFSCERFITRYTVKRALVLNPYTPSDLAARLVPLLTLVDLEEVAEDSGLAEQVRQAARDQLARPQTTSED